MYQDPLCSHVGWVILANLIYLIPRLLIKMGFSRPEGPFSTQDFLLKQSKGMSSDLPGEFQGHCCVLGIMCHVGIQER